MHISSQHCPFVPFFWAINIITGGSSLSCITAITLWLTSVSDTDLKVTMNPDGGELDEFENWSSETAECLVTIDRNGQILNHGQKWVFFYFSRSSSSLSKLSRQLWNICMTLFGTSRDVIAWIICYLVKVLVLYHIHQRSIQNWYHNQRYLLVLPSIFAFWWRYRRSVHLGEGRLIK